jgi:hypothetical protein
MGTATRVLMQVRDALSHLNPKQVREDAARPFTIQLFAGTPEAFRDMESWFAPADLSEARREETAIVVRRGADFSAGTVIRVYDEGLPHDASDFVFRRADPNEVICDILEQHPDLHLSLARRVAPFRPHVAKDIMMSVSKENALFSVATAIPSIMPFLSVPWAAGEFASDTAFLTANQIRMAFMLAAASDRKIGYREQRAEIASLFAGAFGWRAIARELAGKIPMGGGLIPKAAIAFAGTYVVGASLERYYRVGYGYTPEERRAAYEQALERGKEIAAGLVRSVSGKRP